MFGDSVEGRPPVVAFVLVILIVVVTCTCIVVARGFIVRPAVLGRLLLLQRLLHGGAGRVCVILLRRLEEEVGGERLVLVAREVRLYALVLREAKVL